MGKGRAARTHVSRVPPGRRRHRFDLPLLQAQGASGQPLPIFASAGLVYLIINLVVAGFGRLAERAAKRGHA